MDAKELRKKLEEGLKPDVSGKTTPIQRLTPFLNNLVAYLEEGERNPLDMLKKVSSDDPTELASPLTNSEQVSAIKPEAHQPKAQHRDVQQALGTALEPLPANRSAGE